MRRWSFAPMVVFQGFLTTLLSSSCGAQILGDMTDATLRRTGHETKRETGRVSSATESLHHNQKMSAMQTGTRPRLMCPAGTTLKPSTCEGISRCTCVPCQSGSYSSQGSCVGCTDCYDQYGQKEVKSCKPTQDRECGCKEGYFRSGPSDDFTCKKCTRCLNRQIEQNCSEKQDAKCLPDCLPSFCKVGDSCRRCPKNARPSTSSPESHTLTTFTWRQATTPNRIPSEPECGKVCIFGLCGCLILLVGMLVIFWKRRRRHTSASLGGSAKPPRLPGLHNVHVTSFETPAPLDETAVLMDRGPAPHCGSLQQGRKLYTIIDTVPVRRWKEFVRGLGLRDGVIELVELEHSQFREQQYEMLKRWCQQQGASMDAIFAILEDMQLGGCAQELREQLQPQNLQRSP